MWPLHCQQLEVVADAVSFVEETSAMAISLTSALSAKDYHTKEAPLEQEELAGMGQTSNPSLDDENLCQTTICKIIIITYINRARSLTLISTPLPSSLVPSLSLTEPRRVEAHC
jgi:hypothetical protein